jgi:hypothetical protein
MKMNAYFKTVNENGGGYAPRPVAARSKGRISCDLDEAKNDLKSAIINAAYKNGEDGTAYKVERLQTRVAALEIELAA